MGYDLLLDRFHANVQKSPNKLAVAFVSSGNSISIERQLTYLELDEITTKLAKSLKQQYNIQDGDRVVLVYPPSLDFMISFIACCKANIICVPVFPPNPNRRDSIQMFCKIVQECNATVALTCSNYNYVKKLSSIQQSIKTKYSSILNASKTKTIWPDNMQWIVTDSIIDTSTNKKNKKKSKTDSKNKNNDDIALPRNQRPDQTSFLQFTSGSTSDPKGVMITHQNLGHNLTIITNELQASEDTIVVSWLPQYHDMGLIGSYLGILYCGGTGYYMSPLSFLQRPSIWMEAISLYHATHLQAPNFAFKLTCRKFDPTLYSYNLNKDDVSTNASSNTTLLNLSSVRHIINAAEPVDEESMNLFYQTFCPYGLQRGVIYPTYGLAEHTVFVCSGGKQILSVNKHELEVNGIVQIVPEDNNDDASTTKIANTNITRLVGCGYPANQNVIVKIVKDVNTQKYADDGNDNNSTALKPSYVSVGEDTVGEIWVYSGSKAAGYYQKPTETQHDFRAMIDTDMTASGDTPKYKFLRTGDLGFLHEKELFICGRLKDLIIIGGRNYYPQDIEASAESILSDTKIRYGCSAAFAIYPAPDNSTADNGDFAEQVVLLMELRDVPKSADDANKVCQNLADQVRAGITQEHSLGISVIAFLKPKTVPKTSSGKIARSWCRKGYSDRTLQIVYEKSYINNNQGSNIATPLEIEQEEYVASSKNASTTGVDKNDGTAASASAMTRNQKLNDAQIRALDKEQIIERLKIDIGQVASIQPINAIDTKASLSTMMDSLTISQFKGLFEGSYHVKQLSDEYLLRDTTTIIKLSEIVKLGFAPDDNDNNTEGVENAGAGHNSDGAAGGLAGAMGCPPGVVCCVIL